MKKTDNRKNVYNVFFMSVLFVMLVAFIGNTVPVNAKNSTTSITMGVGQTYSITQSLSKKAKCTTSDKRVATIKNGKITAKKTGKTTIKIKDNKKTYTYKVTVSKVYLTKQSLVINKGKATTIRVKGTSSKVKWSSSKSSVATVKNGKITAKKTGTTTIKAKVSGVTLECKVKVENPSMSTTLTIAKGKSSTLAVTGTTCKVTWSAGNSKYVTVKNGKITAKKTGKATITAKVNGSTLKCKVTITNPSLNNTNATVTVGKSISLKVTGTKSKVKWSSSRPTVATVKNGKVTAKSIGKTTITATVDGVTRKCNITVSAKSSSNSNSDSGDDTQNSESTETTDSTETIKQYSLSDTSITWQFGEDAYTELDLNGTDGTESIVWKSSDTDIVKLQTNGSVAYLYYGNHGGIANVTATVGEKTYTCAVKSYYLIEDNYSQKEGTLFTFAENSSEYEESTGVDLNWIWDRTDLIQKKTTTDGTETNYLIEGSGTTVITGISEDGYTKVIMNVTTTGEYIDKKGTYDEELTNEVYELLKTENTRNTDSTSSYYAMSSDQLEFLLATADRWYNGEISNRTTLRTMVYEPYGNVDATGYYGENIYFVTEGCKTITLNDAFSAEKIANGITSYFGNEYWGRDLLYIKIHADENNVYVYLIP